MGLGVLSQVPSDAIPVDVRRAGSRGRGGSWSTDHEGGVRRGQAIVLISETLAREIEGCPVEGARREGIWVAGVGLEGEGEGDGRGTHEALDWLFLDVLGDGGGRMVRTRHRLAQLGLTDRLWQGGGQGSGHGDGGRAFRV
jgi:hypothetical protein